MKIFAQDGKKGSKRQRTWGCIASNTAAVCTAKRKDFTGKKIQPLRHEGTKMRNKKAEQFRAQRSGLKKPQTARIKNDRIP